MAKELQAALDLLGKVLEQGDKLFCADEAWVQYTSAVNDLKSVLETRKQMIRDLPETNLYLKGKFKAAEDVLTIAWKDLSKVQKHAGGCGSCWGCTKAYAFPKTLESRTKFIKDITDSITVAIGNEVDQKTAAERLLVLEGLVPSDNLAPDDRFVPPRNYQADVYNALNDFSESSSLIVFLHGEQGIGKSTLAYHIASEAKKIDGSSEGHASSLSFPVVILMTCGLSQTEESVFKELKGRLQLGADASDAELSNRLGRTKTLIILDDVQDSEIPPKVVRLAGALYRSTKFFITSNVRTVCNRCDPSRIQSIHLELGRIDEEDSRNILLKHTGLVLPEAPISQDLQEIVRIIDKVVKATNGHPLALASFASYVDKDRATDLREWDTAWDDLDAALSDESASTANFHHNYPHSFVATMRLSLKNLGEDAQNLLLLFLTLKREPILEEVLELLYVRLGFGTRVQFRKATALLKERYLISVNRADKGGIWIGDTYFTSWEQHKCVHVMVLYTWHVHPLRRKLLDEEGIPMENKMDSKMQDNIATVEGMGGFIQNKLSEIGEVKEDTNEEDALLVILCDYFFHEKFVPRGNFPERHERWYEGIGPIFLLLGSGGSPIKTSTLYEAAKKVILFSYGGKEISAEDVIPLFQSDAAFASMVALFEHAYVMSFFLTTGRWSEVPRERLNLFAACHLQFMLEVLAEGIQTHMNTKSSHKIKHVLQFFKPWSGWHLRNLYMTRSYPFLIDGIFHVLKLSSDKELGLACCEFLGLLSDEKWGTIAGRMSIMHCRELVSLMVDSLIQRSPPYPNRLSTIVGVLSNVVAIEKGCELVIAKEEPVSGLVEEWCKDSGSWLFKKMVGRLLVNIAMHERGAQLISPYLGAVVDKLRRLLLSLSEVNEPESNNQVSTCICLLSNLVARRKEYCRLVVDADKLGIIFTLADVPSQHMIQRNIRLWISLITNLARHGEFKKLNDQGNHAVLRRLRQVYENFEEEVHRGQVYENFEEEVHRGQVYENFEEEVHRGQVYENFEEEVHRGQVYENFEEEVHRGQVYENFEEEDKKDSEDSSTSMGSSFSTDLETDSSVSTAHSELSEYSGVSEEFDSDSEMGFDDGEFAGSELSYDAEEVPRHAIKFSERFKYEWDDAFPDTAESFWDVFLPNSCDSMVLSRKACQSEVLTLLNLEDPVGARIAFASSEEIPQIQVLISLASAKAKIHRGELREAAEDLEKASIENASLEKDLIDRGLVKKPTTTQRKNYFGWVLWVSFEIKEHILRRQCYVLAALQEWERAIHKAAEMVDFGPRTVFPEWNDKIYDWGSGSKLHRRQSVKRFRMSGLTQRAMILRALHKPSDALTDFDAALEVASTALVESATSIDTLHFHRASWKILKLRAEVKHSLQGEAAAKDDLLAGARHMWFARSVQGIFRFSPFPHYLDQMSSKDFVSKFLNSDEIHMSSGNFVNEFLNSDEFYKAIILNSSNVDKAVIEKIAVGQAKGYHWNGYHW